MKDLKNLSLKSKLKFLKENYNSFYFSGYDIKVLKKQIKIALFYECGDFSFSHKLTFYFPENLDVKKTDIEILAKHLGIIEGLNYWKSFCSENIILKNINLNKKQINFWNKVILKGMFQYFYENKINPFGGVNIKIIADNKESNEIIKNNFLPYRFLVAMGGGKDSIVSFELTKKLVEEKFKKDTSEIFLFSVNPTKIIEDVVKTTGDKNFIRVKREIDKRVLELNKTGFLNGHIPFTGILSFISLVPAIVLKAKNIVFSAEKSASECNVVWHNLEINHQWSKTREFQNLFRQYIKDILPDVDYINYFDNTLEFDIAKLFSLYPKYFKVFSSCNNQFKITENKSKIRWCCECPKCLFVFIILYPFLEYHDIISIFGEDLFEKKSFKNIFDGLIGLENKPFECVGTYKEIQKALNLCLDKIEKESKKLPYLISYYKNLKYNKSSKI